MNLFYVCTLVFCSFFCSVSYILQHVPKSTHHITEEGISKRINKKHSQFLPLRIHTHYDVPKNSAFSLNSVEGVKKIMKTAIKRVQNILLVIPVEGPLIISRNQACNKKWTLGYNKNRCAGIHSGYKGEFCENKINYFQIPEDHLSGLDVYNISSLTPIHSLPTGKGVNNADFIFYISFLYTDWCMSQDVIAYSSFCRLDQNSRPLAGLINFCPNHLEGIHSKDKKSEYIVIHEMFHALGFSHQLFSKFQYCSEDFQCSYWKKVIDISKNIQRIILPSVIKQMKAHFNCNDEDFGAPLEVVDGKATSHWHPLILHGSIMSPQIKEAEFISIDPITIALFADTGWYKVNFSEADDYHWGKGRGCNFGLLNDCQSLGVNYPYMCNTLNSETSPLESCDYLHMSKTYCKTTGIDSLCGIYEPNMKGNCAKLNKMLNDSFQLNHRCFLYKINDEDMKPVCAPFMCTSKSTVDILLNNTWISCPIGTSISLKIKNSTIKVLCPDQQILCKNTSEFRKIERFSYFPLHDKRVLAHIKIEFESPTIEQFKTGDIGSIQDFREMAIIKVSDKLEAPVSWLFNNAIQEEENLILYVSVLPPSHEYHSFQEIRDVVYRLQKFLHDNRFYFVYRDTVALSTSIQNDPYILDQRFINSGFDLLAVVIGGILGAIIVTFIFTSIIQYYQYQR